MARKLRRFDLATMLPANGLPVMEGYWRLGEKARLARTAGITPQSLADILARRRVPRAVLAAKLEIASGVVLGRRRMIPQAEWRTCDISTHPAFKTPEEEAESGVLMG